MAMNDELRFLVVGASTAGLASAIALKAAGHHVLILERDSELGGTSSIPTGGLRLPPNGCKILFDWGLEAEIRANAVVGQGFTVYKYEGTDSERDYIGSHYWDLELLNEARGDFLQMRHRELLRILYNEALLERPGNAKTAGTVVIQFNAEVVDADFEACSVRLASGSVHSGDVLIGADGASGYFRRRFLNEQGRNENTEQSVLAVYSAIIPKESAVADSQLAKLYEYPQRKMVTFSMGSNRGAQAFIAGKDKDVVFWIYTPDTSEDGSWTQVAEKGISHVVGHCDPLIQRLANLAGPPTCVQIKNHQELQSWVSDSGKVLVLGEAAHPFPVIALHAYSIAIEDGAFLGKIFSHTRNRARIAEFLHAFEESRRHRCAHIDESEKQYITAMTLPSGPGRVATELAMRANAATGHNVMDSASDDLQHMWDDMRRIFGYDPADDADEWWVSWGRLRDAPNAS
ncbi:FAD-binding-3 domain-containing protein [Favolaschia claudopus]|uniref:FAD-binding-3 domain-containing protein n=1 Tax=Favolaschia claudopus TaxID=2862362 RepID=A0AAW0CYY5_9AGAR